MGFKVAQCGTDNSLNVSPSETEPGHRPDCPSGMGSVSADVLAQFDADLRQWSAEFDLKLGELFHDDAETPPQLNAAMRYTLLAPGKRLRPFLVYRCCELVGGSESEAFAAASAVECVHAFSLIHDDLPAMDDDDVRRGQPANHVRFGEAMAILAGDALLAAAFESLVQYPGDSRRVQAMVRELALASGRSGMIGGQVADLDTGVSGAHREALRTLYLRKTARLIECSCKLGAIAGAANAAQTDKLAAYGLHLGVAFQITDDLLDAEQTPTGGVSIPDARHWARQEGQRAVDCLDSWGDEADTLQTLVGFVLQRTY